MVGELDVEGGGWMMKRRPRRRGRVFIGKWLVYDAPGEGGHAFRGVVDDWSMVEIERRGGV